MSSDRLLPAPRKRAGEASSARGELERAARYAASALSPANTPRLRERLARVRRLVRPARAPADARCAGRPSPHSWPPRSTASSARSRSPAGRRRSPPRAAPKTAPTRTTPAPWRRSWRASGESTAPGRYAKPRRSSSTPGAPAGADRHLDVGRSARPGAPTSKVPARSPH